MPAVCIDQLTRQLKQKKTSAFNELYDLYAAALFGYILRHRYPHKESETMLVTVFQKAWEQIGGFDPGKQRLFTWLFHLTRNEITMRHGKALHPFSNQSVSITGAAPKAPAKSPE